MALTKPILASISAFDAHYDKIVIFSVQSGQQVIGNTLTIVDQATGSTVYNQYVETFQYQQTIPANTLTNGNSYQATVITKGVGDETSPASNPVQFKCFTTPVISINNIPDTGIVRASNYVFTGSYSQAENELLQSFEFNLYNSNHVLLSTSGAVYSQTIQYPFYGFEDNTAYYIELITYTVNGMVASTGQILFNVDYESPNFYSINSLENLCQTGQIQVSSNIKIIEGKSYPTPPEYIDEKAVDLRPDGYWVRFDEGFSIDKDFTLKMIGRDFNDNSQVINMNSSNNDYTIKINYVVDNFTYDSEKAFFELYAYNSNTNDFSYYIKSNVIDKPESTEDIFLWTRRIGSLFDIQIENLGVEA